MSSPNKVVFVGQGPNRTAWNNGLEAASRFGHAGDAATKWAENYCRRIAITGSVGRKLAAISGCDLEAREELRFYAVYERRNLNARWNGKSGKGDVFDRIEGALAAEKIIAEGFEKHVLLGQEVARSFGMGRNEPLVVVKNLPGTQTFLLFPHPSGISTWWNEKFNRYRAEKALREFLKP